MDLAIQNQIDRFSLAMDVIDRVPSLHVAGAHAKERLRNAQIECQRYAYENGVDKPEIDQWKWPASLELREVFGKQSFDRVASELVAHNDQFSSIRKDSRMRNLCLVALLGTLVLAAVGCATTIPAKLQVRDVSSGRTYYTYQPWGQVEKGIGYAFVDSDTGNHITLTNYELKTVEGPKSVANDSPEAKSFEAAKARGGLKD